jgi:hypothetical protein
VAAALGEIGEGEDAGPSVEGPLDRYGRLSTEEHRRVAGRAIAEVVRPAARSLQGIPPSPAGRSATKGCVRIHT